MPDGGGDNAKGLGGDAYESIEPLNFPGPAEVSGVNDAGDTFEGVHFRFGSFGRFGVADEQAANTNISRSERGTAMVLSCFMDTVTPFEFRNS